MRCIFLVSLVVLAEMRHVSGCKNVKRICSHKGKEYYADEMWDTEEERCACREVHVFDETYAVPWCQPAACFFTPGKTYKPGETLAFPSRHKCIFTGPLRSKISKKAIPTVVRWERLPWQTVKVGARTQRISGVHTLTRDFLLDEKSTKIQLIWMRKVFWNWIKDRKYTFYILGIFLYTEGILTYQYLSMVQCIYNWIWLILHFLSSTPVYCPPRAIVPIVPTDWLSA